VRFMNLTKTGGHVFWGFICWAVGENWIGSWWVGLWRWRLILKAPWSEPLFSERYGHTWTLRLGFGWRLQSKLAQRS
jgi:hypothetical protein